MIGLRTLAAAGAALTALAASHLDALALTSGASLPSGNGSSVVVTGALAAAPSPTAVIDQEDFCLADWVGQVIPPIEGLTGTTSNVGQEPPFACMAAAAGLDGGPSVTADATWVGATSSAGGFVVTMTCQASASVGVVTVDEPLRTTVNDCYLRGADGLDYVFRGPVTEPGAAAAIAAESLSLPVQRYQVCVDASASYVGGSTPSAGGCM